MKVSSISNINFESKVPKRHFFNENTHVSIISLLLRMNGETTREKVGDSFKSTITTKLHYNNNEAIFEDERRLTEKVLYNDQMQGFSSLQIGKTVLLDIDNKTGEIIDCIKPFYKPFFLVKRKAARIISEIRSNFNLPDVVKKERLTIRELTPEGQKTMKKFVLEMEKKRLEQVIKELEETSK